MYLNFFTIKYFKKALTQNLLKFKEDRDFIYEALKKFSIKNSNKISKKIKTLLNIDEVIFLIFFFFKQKKGFLIKEPDWKDPVYLAKLIVICNVINLERNIQNEMPFYFEKHYNYIKDIFPKFIESNDEIKKISKKNNNSLYCDLFSSILDNFFNFKDSENFKKIESISKLANKLKHVENPLDIFITKICKNFAKMNLIRKAFLDQKEIDENLLYKIMKSIFQIQEKYLNIEDNLNFLFEIMKYFCLLFFPINLLEKSYSGVFEHKKFFNLILSISDISHIFKEKSNEFPNNLRFSNKIFLLCKEILSNPNKLNDFNERRKCHLAYKDAIRSDDFFDKIGKNYSFDFPSELKLEKIILVEPKENYDDYLLIDSKFIAKLDIVFDTYNINDVINKLKFKL